MFGTNIKKLIYWEKKKDISRLIKASQKKPEFQSFVAASLGRIKDPTGIDYLVKLLYSQDESLRKKAGFAIKQINSPASVPLLFDVLRSNSKQSYKIAKEILSEICDSQSIGALLDALNEQVARVNEFAYRILGCLKDEKILNHLVSFIKDKNKNSRARGQAIQFLANILGSKATEMLIEMLKDQDCEIRRASANTLGRFGSEQGILPLIRSIEDPNLGVSREASDALANLSRRGYKIPSEEIIPILGKSNTNKDVKQLVYKILGEAGIQISPKYIQKGIQNKNQDVKLAVIRAIHRTPTPHATLPLLEVLNDHGLDRSVRIWAARALREIKDDRAVDHLIETLSDRWVAPAAAQALGGIRNAKAVEPLIEALESDNRELRREAVLALGYIGDSKAVSSILKCVDDEDSSVQTYAMDALAKIKSLEAVDPLIQILVSKSRKKQIRRKSAEVLGILGNSKAIPALMEALSELTIPCEVINNSLLEIYHVSGIDPILQIFNCATERTKGLSLDILAQTQDVRVIPSLLNYMFGKPVVFKNGSGFCPSFSIFGSYASIIHDLLSYKEWKKKEVWVITQYVTKYSLDASSAALEKLITLTTPISDKLLHLISNIKDFPVALNTILPMNSHRDKASEELKKRGNLLVDESVLLNTKAWQS